MAHPALSSTRWHGGPAPRSPQPPFGRKRKSQGRQGQAETQAALKAALAPRFRVHVQPRRWVHQPSQGAKKASETEVVNCFLHRAEQHGY